MEWLPEHDARLRDYRSQNLPFHRIAELMNFLYGTDEFTKDSCQKRLQRLGRQILAIPPLVEPMPFFRKYFDEDGQPLQYAPKPSWPQVEHTLSTTPLIEGLVTSDWHIDQHDEALLELVFNRHTGCQVHFIAGDMLDLFALSRFEKECNRPVEWELEGAVRWLEFSSNTYPITVIIDSNHLARARRSIKVPESLGFLLEPNLMRHLATPFNNVIVIDNWYVQMGDAVITHADLSKGKAAKTAQAVHNYLFRRYLANQVALTNWRLLVQAHTHQVGSIMDGHVKLGETGCMARLPLHYTTEAGAVKYAQPQVNGYYTILQRYGKTDLNLSREYYLGG